MDLSFGTKPFGFDRIFHSHDENAPIDSRDKLSLIVQIETLQSELKRLNAGHLEELARARADGFQAGMDAARGDREQAILAAADAINAGVETLMDQHQAFRETMTREAGELITAVAQHLAGHPMLTSPERAIDHAIGNALAQVARGTEITIHVHPDLAPAIEEVIAARQAKDRRALRLFVTPNTTIVYGDARIEWDQGGMILDRAERELSILRELENLFPQP